MAVSDRRFDYLAANAGTHVILGGGGIVAHAGGLPRNAGVHVVAGTAQLGEWELVGTMPNYHWPTWSFSPDLRWMAVDKEDVVVLYDLANGVRRGFTFPIQGQRRYSVHPSGEMILLRNGADFIVLLPDGEELCRRAFPARDGWETSEEWTFSSCGEYVWLARRPANGPESLCLLRVPSLEVLESVPLTEVAEDLVDLSFSGRQVRLIRSDPFSDRLVIIWWADDRTQPITSVSENGGRIRVVGHKRPRIADVDSGVAHGLAFRDDRRHVLSLDDAMRLSEYDVEDDSPEQTRSLFDLSFPIVCTSNLPDEIAYSGDVILIKRWNGVSILRSGEGIRPIGIIPFMMVDGLLPNGMTVWQRPDGVTEFRRMRRRGGRDPVVVEVDSDDGTANRFWGQVPGGWEDITGGVLWANTAFEVQNE